MSISSNTEIDIQKLEGLLEKASAAPWAACEPRDLHNTLISANPQGHEGRNDGIYVAKMQGPDNVANAHLVVELRNQAATLLSEITSLRKRVEEDQWQPIGNATETVERCLLWCIEAGPTGQGDAVVGAVYVYDDGTIRARGNSMHGDWTFTHWHPLPATLDEGGKR